jgi:hypothetical protein
MLLQHALQNSFPQQKEDPRTAEYFCVDENFVTELFIIFKTSRSINWPLSPTSCSCPMDLKTTL